MPMAITTEYHGPTNSKGSRVKAIARKRESWGDRTMPEMSHTEAWDHRWNADRNHVEAAALCAIKYGWTGLYVGGAVSGGGFAFVNIGPAKDELAEALKATGYSREGIDFFRVTSRYTMQPEKDQHKADGLPESEGTWFVACSDEEAEHWSAFDNVEERILADFTSRKKAEAFRIEMTRRETFGHFGE